MTEDRRALVAAQLRELGHEFVAHDLSDATLDALESAVQILLPLVREEPIREWVPRIDLAERVELPIPDEAAASASLAFAHSLVAGGSNPMGLGAKLWREGDIAAMRVTLGRAFEGAPGRSHGGVIASLADETMGLAASMNGAFGLTANLSITYRAAAPLNEPITARGWIASRDGRKVHLAASVTSGDLLIAEATALFITIEPESLRESGRRADV